MERIPFEFWRTALRTRKLNRMRRLSKWIFTLAAAGGFAAYGQQTGPVQIATGEVKIEYCDADPDLVMATVHVKVIFTNRGKKNLILSRDFGVGEPAEYVTVRDMAGAVVFAPDFSYYETKPIELGKTPDDRLFEIVKPSATVERDLAVGLPVSKKPAGIVGDLTPGNYRISASRSTWPVYSDGDRAKGMRDEWKPYGSLVIMQVRVHDVPVEIALPQQMDACK
jgi:hypothetical protein